jgi:hypothetical protein
MSGSLKWQDIPSEFRDNLHSFKGYEERRQGDDNSYRR